MLNCLQIRYETELELTSNKPLIHAQSLSRVWLCNPMDPRGVRPRLEGKPRTPLSCQVATGISWSSLCGLKWVKPPVEFGERTQDCSPGHTAKEGPHLMRTGASRGYSRAAAPVWCCSRGIMGSSGSLSSGASEVRFLWAWLGGARQCSRVKVGESHLKTRWRRTLEVFYGLGNSRSLLRLMSIESVMPSKWRRIHFLLKCTWNILQDRPHLGSQIKPQ